MTIYEKVQSGIKWMNTNYPGWENIVNLDTLDVCCGNNCIIGQSNGMGYSRRSPMVSFKESCDLGLHIPSTELIRDRDYLSYRNELMNSWKEEITKLREKK